MTAVYPRTVNAFTTQPLHTGLVHRTQLKSETLILATPSNRSSCLLNNSHTINHTRTVKNLKELIWKAIEEEERRQRITESRERKSRVYNKRKRCLHFSLITHTTQTLDPIAEKQDPSEGTRGRHPAVVSK